MRPLCGLFRLGRESEKCPCVNCILPSANRLLKKEPMNFRDATFCLGLGSATVPAATVGVPPTEFRWGSFRPEAESSGRDARAPQKNAPSRLDSCRAEIIYGQALRICLKINLDRKWRRRANIGRPVVPLRSATRHDFLLIQSAAPAMNPRNATPPAEVHPAAGGFFRESIPQCSCRQHNTDCSSASIG